MAYFTAECEFEAFALVIGLVFAGTVDGVIAGRSLAFAVLIIVAITFYAVDGRACIILIRLYSPRGKEIQNEHDEDVKSIFICRTESSE